MEHRAVLPLSWRATRTMMMMMMMMTMMMMTQSPAAAQNFCPNHTVLRTQTSCHSCGISALIPCPKGYRQTPQSLKSGCKFEMSGIVKLQLTGCSFQCYKEEEVQTCCSGYWGPDCLACPAAADQHCSGRGVCSEGLGGNGTCSCQEGFAGTACEDCAPGRYGLTCGSVCKCLHGLCRDGLTGNGQCTCYSGYKGLHCDQELPECTALRCQPNAHCVEEVLTGRLVCHCLPGYQNQGDQCLPINPCLQKPCHVYASCVYTGPNQHLCACHEGYSGDGKVCLPVDPCQSNQGGCPVGTSRCIYDGPRKSHCECLSGFEPLPGGGCRLRNSCKPTSCHRKANCSTVPTGEIQCTCWDGYVGNGRVCYGNIMERMNDLNTQPGERWTNQLSSAITLFGLLSWPLQNRGPFTIFVPINRGFRGTSIDTLTKDVSKAKYLCNLHLVAGTMTYDALKKADIFYTLTGKSAETGGSGDYQPKIRIHGNRKKGMVIQSDLVASNGMIHIINKLMDPVPPTVESDTQGNLIKILSDNGKFEKFKSLLEKTGLASILDTPGPFTVFAPCNRALDDMEEGHFQYLSCTEGRHKLLEFLRNHIVSSTSLEVYNAVPSTRIISMANQVLAINLTEAGQILVNGAVVLETAVEAKNGRLYVLDGILTPPTIEPLLPHRCDITKTQIVHGMCVKCSEVKLYQCSPGVNTGLSSFGCLHTVTLESTPQKILAMGCTPHCNTTVTTSACCGGFFGPDCRPCPGGYLTPCSGRGKCSEGMSGNGSCTCEPNFGGSHCQFCSSLNKYGPTCDKTCPCIHGQCKNHPDSDGSCRLNSCQPGFTGRFCERRTVPCGVRVQYCHAHADCDFNLGFPKCVCKPGFQGDGITCVESDPCALPLRGGCGVNAKCVKTGPGTHVCQCLRGWKEDGDECQPINNCQAPDRGGCHQNATCIYVGPAQSDCSCKAGFHGNGQSCEPVNQCVTEEGGCHFMASCHLLSSKWTCVCEDGFLGDGRVCYGSVEQEFTTLQVASNFYAWITVSGLSSSFSDPNITVLVPSSDAISQMSTDDKNFWTLKGNLPSLIRNHVVLGVYPLSRLKAVSSVTSLLSSTLPVSFNNQITTVSGATIVTANIPSTNGHIHIIDKVLVPDRKLSEGLLATLAQRPELSLFRSYLQNFKLTNEIEASGEFTVFAPTDAAIKEYLRKTSLTSLDVNTTRYHVVTSQRLLRTDLQLGGYRPTLLGQSFQLGFFPREGKLLVNGALVNASNILCGNGAIHGISAVLQIIRNRCDQTTSRKIRGLCVDCLFHNNNICPEDSVPDESVKSKKCAHSRLVNGKASVGIGCRATCLQKKTEPRCCSGFFGEHCEPCPESKNLPCSGNGACSDGTSGTGVCQCFEGFNGTACESCRRGKYGIHCDQDCQCRNGQCNEGPSGDGTCECDVGWRGVHCDEKIEFGADEQCGLVKCHSSANCVIRPSGPGCLCAAGFRGNGTTCAAVDPCLTDNGGCSPFSVCKRTKPGLRDCVCQQGYTGDGLVCVEINPCVGGNGGCHLNADCIHVGPNKTSCSCRHGYTGDGWNCRVINPCQTNNGGCHRFARCNMTGPGNRSCACTKDFIGDGVRCKGTVQRELNVKGLKNFLFSSMVAGLSLYGRGPFTVFAPNAEALANTPKLTLLKSREMFLNHVRSHVVMCHTLFPADISQPRNLTSLSGFVLTTGSNQGTIFINQANVTHSDDVSVNGIIHEINRFLNPPNNNSMLVQERNLQNLSNVARRHGFENFYKLLEDKGVMALVTDPRYRPVTLFLPSDSVMASLPQEQKDFLFHQDNHAQLQEYLKYHVLQGQEVYAEGLVYLDSGRTLQGSSLSFSCGGIDNIGDILVGDRKCRVTRRHLLFREGIAYMIDCLLTPPSLGGRCDTQSHLELKMECGPCHLSSSKRCPPGSKLTEVEKCDLPSVHISRDTGCRRICNVNFWNPKCCSGFFGRDCLTCPGGAQSPCSNHGTCDDGHLGNGTCSCETGFGGVACEQCLPGFFGPTCIACNCSDHGACDEGHQGTGQCFCDAGWTGDRCDVQIANLPQCWPPCSSKAVCKQNNTCVCRPFYLGDGLTCTVVDMCSVWNGGCAKGAQCSQMGEAVTCTCPQGHSGDGFVCLPADPCIAGDNGGCHQHAICTMTAPGKRKCSCKDRYIGDGLNCELKEVPISRCFQDNGGCHQDAKCTDLHFQDATLGVFHYRSPGGQYRLTFSAAQQACAALGASLASYTQLSYAQQSGMNMCAAGWLDEARVGYPTTYANQNCGFGHVGIVDYGTRKNLSETWDTFCYRIKEVQCDCRQGYIGNGLSCTGNLLEVLRSTPTFSNFLSEILKQSETTESGRKFLECLSDPVDQSTLFVPDNSGFSDNQTLSSLDLEFHLSKGRTIPLSHLKNGSRIRTRVGSLSVQGVADPLDPTVILSYFVNGQFITSGDILASNGVIHVLQGPLNAPPHQQQMHVAQRTGLGVGVTLLLVLLALATFVGYRFCTQSRRQFYFHYFKDDDEEEAEAPSKPCSHSITNPVYEAAPELEETSISPVQQDKDGSP